MGPCYVLLYSSIGRNGRLGQTNNDDDDDGDDDDNDDDDVMVTW